MWILAIQSEAGSIAHVLNPEDVPHDFDFRGVHTWIGGLDAEDPTTPTGAEACRVSRAKGFPRQWRDARDARQFFDKEWHGWQVRYEDGRFVSVGIMRAYD